MKSFRDPLQREIHRLDLLFADTFRVVNEHIALNLLEQKRRLDERKAAVLKKLAGRLSDS